MEDEVTLRIEARVITENIQVTCPRGYNAGSTNLKDGPITGGRQDRMDS
jgi:hypothetical protein